MWNSHNRGSCFRCKEDFTIGDKTVTAQTARRRNMKTRNYHTDCFKKLFY